MLKKFHLDSGMYDFNRASMRLMTFKASCHSQKQVQMAINLLISIITAFMVIRMERLVHIWIVKYAKILI